MRKFIIAIIPISLITLFILVMLSDSLLKLPLSDDDNIQEIIQSIMQNVKDDEWDLAEIKTEQFSKAWKRVSKRIQFGAEKDGIGDLDISIARLRGAIMARDKSNALMELSEAKEHWDNVGR